MIYSLTGELLTRGENFVVVNVGGLGLKVFTHRRTLQTLPSAQNKVSLFCHLHVREDALDLFGFASPEELHFFELLISISGVGPKSALSVLEISDLRNLAAAIQEGRPDLLTQASGIGRKTAERIILELKNKVKTPEGEATVGRMETDADLLETLTSLGYRREQARAALDHVDRAVVGIEDRLKAALKLLASKK
jgi:holliday junction DNA helicase RuvA